MSYVKLSDDANDGLLMWITIGVNTTADYDELATPAAHYYPGGGKSSPGGPGGGGFPPFPVNGTGRPSGVPFPTGGGMPTGFPGFPTGPAGPTQTAKPWGPCASKQEDEVE